MIKFSDLWFVQLSGNIPQEETAELRARVCERACGGRGEGDGLLP